MQNCCFENLYFNIKQRQWRWLFFIEDFDSKVILLLLLLIIWTKLCIILVFKGEFDDEAENRNWFLNFFLKKIIIAYFVFNLSKNKLGWWKIWARWRAIWNVRFDILLDQRFVCEKKNQSQFHLKIFPKVWIRRRVELSSVSTSSSFLFCYLFNNSKPAINST